MGMNATQVKRSADVGRVLERLGVEYEQRDEELFALCPNPDHDDRSVGTWSIHSEPGSDANGLSFCFACGWSGDIFSVVEQVLGCEFLEALHFVARGGRVRVLEFDDGEVEDAAIYWRPLRPWKPQPLDLPRGCRPVKPRSKCGRYLDRRGYGPEDVEWAGIVDWRRKGRLLVPLTVDGVMVSWVARSYAGGVPKVLTPKACKGTRWAVFGMDKADRSLGLLNVAEGWADAMRMRQAGLPNPVGLCGSKLTPEKILAMTWAASINVWADGDEAGRSMVADVAGFLGCGRRVAVAMMPDGEDPDDQRPEALAQINPVALRDHKRTGD